MKKDVWIRGGWMSAAAGLVGAFSIVQCSGAQTSGAQTEAGRSPQPQPSAQQDSPAQRWLEFDMPAGGDSMSAIIVGYFPPGKRSPAFTFEVPRERLESPRQGSMRIPLVVGDLPEGQTYSIRLRTVVNGRQSGWSEPSGVFTVPPNASAAVGVPVAAPYDRRPPRSAALELEQDPALKARVAAEFTGVDLTKAAEGYESVRDLATDLFVSANLKIPFADLKRLRVEGKARNLPKSIAELKPGAKSAREARRAREQARQLVRPPAHEPQKK